MSFYYCEEVRELLLREIPEILEVSLRFRREPDLAEVWGMVELPADHWRRAHRGKFALLVPGADVVGAIRDWIAKELATPRPHEMKGTSAKALRAAHRRLLQGEVLLIGQHTWGEGGIAGEKYGLRRFLAGVVESHDRRSSTERERAESARRLLGGE